MIGEELQPAVISEQLYTFVRDFGQTAGVYVEVSSEGIVVMSSVPQC